jgi:hypothetical protein
MLSPFAVFFFETLIKLKAFAAEIFQQFGMLSKIVEEFPLFSFLEFQHLIMMLGAIIIRPLSVPLFEGKEIPGCLAVKAFFHIILPLCTDLSSVRKFYLP